MRERETKETDALRLAAYADDSCLVTDENYGAMEEHARKLERQRDVLREAGMTLDETKARVAGDAAVYAHECAKLRGDRDELLAALREVLPRLSHKAVCCSVQPTEEWAVKGSVSFDDCLCGIKVMQAILAKHTKEPK